MASVTFLRHIISLSSALQDLFQIRFLEAISDLELLPNEISVNRMIAPISSDQENDHIREDSVVSINPPERMHLAALEFDADLLSSNFLTKVQLAVALDADLAEDQRNCCLGSNPHRYHVLLLRIVGGFCIVFGSISIGIGSHLRIFFSNFIAGPWWNSLPVIVAGASHRSLCTSTDAMMTILLSQNRPFRN